MSCLAYYTPLGNQVHACAFRRHKLPGLRTRLISSVHSNTRQGREDLERGCFHTTASLGPRRQEVACSRRPCGRSSEPLPPKTLTTHHFPTIPRLNPNAGIQAREKSKILVPSKQHRMRRKPWKGSVTVMFFHATESLLRSRWLCAAP